MTRKLLLTSQGLATEEIEKAFLDTIRKPLDKSVIGYVPNAGDLKKDNKYIGQARVGLQKRGPNVIDINLKVLKARALEERLNDVNIIYVEGGNAFYLLDVMRKSGFAQILPRSLDEGKVYVGVSAGSYVVCPTIEATTWKHADRNVIGLKDLTGLNLVPFLITAHFEEKYRSVIETAAKHTDYPIVALHDTQAILVENDRHSIVGPGTREFFNGFKEKVR